MPIDDRMARQQAIDPRGNCGIGGGSLEQQGKSERGHPATTPNFIGKGQHKIQGGFATGRFDIMCGNPYQDRVKNVSIAITDDAIEWAMSRVDAGEFASMDAYFSDLAGRDRADAEWLQSAIDKGFASGIDPRSSSEIFADARSKHIGRDASAGV